MERATTRAAQLPLTGQVARLRVAWRTVLTGVLLFAAFAALLAAVQFSTPALAGNDGYYHIRLAWLMRIQGVDAPFPWLPLTVLNEAQFVDHHFLYHLLLLPFTYGDLRLGAKMSGVLFPALAFLAAWWLLRARRVPYAALWSLGLLAVSEAFIYRMSMPRAQSLSLAVLFLALHWLLAGRHRLLLPLAFAYVWLYNGFPLILLLAGVYVAARWLVERRVTWRPLAYVSAGIALGLLAHPDFPHNLLFLARHVGPKLVDPVSVSVGSEWYPYRTTQLLENSAPALLVFVAGIVALGLHAGRMDVATATGLFLSVLFGAMLFRSRRFVEYFPPFALLFAALAWSPVVRGYLAGAKGDHARLRRRALAGLGALILVPALAFTLPASRRALERSKPYTRYAGAAAWLQENTPPGARVFQTDWDDFPRLFYYNTHNTYTLGLDPTYMQSYDPALYELWVDITRARVVQPSAVISRDFGATYVFTDRRHDAFLHEADDDPALVEVYRDEEAIVLQVLPVDAGAQSNE